ncbi:ankyrin repeat-containing domain protein [Tricladium varicosporioides]|nr:ankyrin repeat-containing domain protein [Hymenoscyphus varicosporioides]
MAFSQLPMELFQQLMEEMVKTNGLDEAMRLRLVCKSFDEELIRAICITRALEETCIPAPRRTGPGTRYFTRAEKIRTVFQSRYRGKRLLSEYLYHRAITDPGYNIYFPQTVTETIDYIFKHGFVEGDHEVTRLELSRELCKAAVDAHGPNIIASVISESKCHQSTDLVPTFFCTEDGKGNLWNNTLLTASIVLNLDEMFEELLSSATGSCCELTYFGHPLEMVALRGDWHKLRALLERFTWTWNRLRMTIAKAACSGSEVCVDLLIDIIHLKTIKKAKRDELWKTYQAIVCNAAENGHTRLVESMIERMETAGFDVWQHDCLGYSAVFTLDLPISCAILWHAAKGGFHELVEFALDMDGNPDTVALDENVYRTALGVAIRFGHERVVSILLENGADVNPEYGTGRHPGDTEPPLLTAVKRGLTRITHTLIDHGASRSMNGLGGIAWDQFPLIVATKRNQIEVVKLLFEKGVEMVGGDCNALEVGKFAYLHARRMGFMGISNLFEAHGVVIGVVEEYSTKDTNK